MHIWNLVYLKVNTTFIAIIYFLQSCSHLEHRSHYFTFYSYIIRLCRILFSFVQMYQLYVQLSKIIPIDFKLYQHHVQILSDQGCTSDLHGGGTQLSRGYLNVTLFNFNTRLIDHKLSAVLKARQLTLFVTFHDI